MTQFAVQDHLYKNSLKPLAEYIIMFINSQGLLKWKEYEKTGILDEEKVDDSGVTKISSAADISRVNEIHAVGQDIDGNIKTEKGNVNIGDIMKQLQSAEMQKSKKLKSKNSSGLGFI